MGIEPVQYRQLQAAVLACLLTPVLKQMFTKNLMIGNRNVIEKVIYTVVNFLASRSYFCAGAPICLGESVLKKMAVAVHDGP